jgi:transcriptional regulator with XRE-family HTH domain
MIPVARLLADARLSDEAALLDAAEARRVQIGLSLAELDRLSGLTVGHASKCLSPGRTKSPSTRTLYAMLDTLGLSLLALVDGAKVSHMSPSWRPRAENKVRQRALSPVTLQRARPIVLRELLRRARHPRWKDTPAPAFLQAMALED